MSNAKNYDRATLLQRYEQFRELAEDNQIIAALEIAYRQTRNEYVLRALTMLKKKREAWNDFDAFCRDEEIQEFWDNPGKFPHSIRIWFMHYRDDELAD